MVLLAVLAGALAGCAQPVAGAPAPAPPQAAGVSPTTATPTTATPAPDLPPRPREVRLDGLDPCTLLPRTDLAELGLEAPPRLTVAPSGLYGGEVRLCTARGYEPRVVSAGVILSVTGGIDLYLRPGVRSEITPIDVEGFPAIVAVPTTLRDFCTVVVDIAPGQAVDVQVADGGGVPPVPQAGLCADAERTAAAVMQNLLAAR